MVDCAMRRTEEGQDLLVEQAEMEHEHLDASRGGNRVQPRGRRGAARRADLRGAGHPDALVHAGGHDRALRQGVVELACTRWRDRGLAVPQPTGGSPSSPVCWHCYTLLHRM